MKQKFLLLIMLLFSCSKHNNQTTTIPIGTAAVVINAGAGSIDGCDWMIVINDSNYYHPDSLPENVKQDNLPVLINYLKTSDSFYCGIANTAHQIIHIINIKPN